MEYKEVVVAKVSELPDGTMKQVAVEGGEILLTNVKGKISALGAFCTHYNARLENGILSGDTIVCPSHQACFCAKSGDLKEPPALNALPKFEVEVRGDDVVVKLPEKIGKMPDSRHGFARSGARSADVRHSGSRSRGECGRTIPPAKRLPGKNPDDFQ